MENKKNTLKNEEHVYLVLCKYSENKHDLALNLLLHYLPRVVVGTFVVCKLQLSK